MAAPSFKLAANLTLLFNDLAANYLDKYRVAAELGFRYIESWFPPVGVTLEQLVAAQTRHGLKQVLINTEVDENFGYAAVKGGHFVICQPKTDILDFSGICTYSCIYFE
jgi:Hydroxypyruvate isomerase